MRRLLALAIAAFLLSGISVAVAHEVRPAYLEIERTSKLSYKIVWKQPTLGDVAIHLVPHLSNGWLERPPADQFAAPDFLIRTWLIRTPRPVSLNGQSIAIEGLKDTLTDVLVRVHLERSQSQDAVLRPDVPQMRIALTDGNTMSMPAFLFLGIEHILTGPDHLLFVLGLLLIVRDRWALLKTISAFTLAHSITLSLAAFGQISLSLPLLNALIALSILFIAPEVIRAQAGGSSLAIRQPWIVAFFFGLLHGMGFANGLTSLGLGTSALLSALVLFNIGVEIGQLAFVALILALRRSFRLLEIRWPRPLALAPTYAIGILGAGWAIRYGAVLFGVAL